MLVLTHRLFWLLLLALGWTLFATNEPKSNVWAHYKHFLWTMFSIDESMPNTWVHIVEDHQKTRYKPTSFKGSSPQASKDQTNKPTSFKGTSHKLQRHKPTRFKGTIPQASKASSKLQELKPTSSQASRAKAYNTQTWRLQSLSSKPTKQWPTITSFKNLKPKFKPTKM